MHLLLQGWTIVVLLIGLTSCENVETKERPAENIAESPKDLPEQMNENNRQIYSRTFKLHADYHITVAPRTSECFYINFNSSTDLYLNFEVRILIYSSNIFFVSYYVGKAPISIGYKNLQ